MRLTAGPLTVEDAEAIARWRYQPPYDLYNAGPEEIEAAAQTYADPASCYLGARDDQGTLIAFICFGVEARVPGGDYTEDALDVGCGLRPELTGRGLGPALIQTALD